MLNPLWAFGSRATTAIQGFHDRRCPPLAGRTSSVAPSFYALLISAQFSKDAGDQAFAPESKKEGNHESCLKNAAGKFTEFGRRTGGSIATWKSTSSMRVCARLSCDQKLREQFLMPSRAEIFAAVGS